MQDELGSGIDGKRLRHVQLGSRARDGVRKHLLERGAELAARARDQDALSRSERIGLSVLHRCLTRGSSHGIPFSSGSAGSYSRVTW